MIVSITMMLWNEFTRVITSSQEGNHEHRLVSFYAHRQQSSNHDRHLMIIGSKSFYKVFCGVET